MKANRILIFWAVAAILFFVTFGFRTEANETGAETNSVKVKVDATYISHNKVALEFLNLDNVPEGYKLLIFSGFDQKTQTFGRALEVESGVLGSSYVGQFNQDTKFTFYMACVKDLRKSTDHYVRVLSNPESIEACGGTGEHFVCRPDRLGYYFYNNIEVPFEIVNLEIQQIAESPVYVLECH